MQKKYISKIANAKTNVEHVIANLFNIQGGISKEIPP